MSITKAKLEEDISCVLKSLANDDYIIPSNKITIFPIIKYLSPYYALSLFWFLYCFVVGRGWLDDQSSWIMAGMIFLFVNAIFTVFILLTFYDKSAMYFSLSKDVREKSVLISIARRKIKNYTLTHYFLNVLISFALFNIETGFVLFLGVSYLVTFMFFVIAFNASMSRYLTPTVMATLNKVHETIISGKQIA